MIRFALSLLAIALITTGLVVGAVYFVPATVPGWLPTSGIEASPDAREIAAALSTPPTHLAAPTQYALYHWQTLIAGLLAFFGGLGALAAAYIGAQALNKQTALAQSAQEREEKIQIQQKKEESYRERRRVAGAIYAEISEFVSNIDAFCTRRRSEKYQTKENFISLFNSLLSHDDVPPIFDAMRQHLGLFPVETGMLIVKFYSTERWTTRSLIAFKKKISTENVEIDEMNRYLMALVGESDKLVKTGRDIISILEKDYKIEKD